MSIRLSREKVNYLSRQILDKLFEDDEIEFLDEANEIRLSIVNCIEDEMNLYESIDKKAIEKIETQKKSIKEGSREWEILYRKYYNEEITKLGKFFTWITFFFSPKLCRDQSTCPLFRDRSNGSGTQ